MTEQASGDGRDSNIEHRPAQEDKDLVKLESLIIRLEELTMRAEAVANHLAQNAMRQATPGGANQPKGSGEVPPAPPQPRATADSQPRTKSIGALIAEQKLQIAFSFAASIIAIIVVIYLFSGR
jgi:hypothetical protein